MNEVTRPPDTPRSIPDTRLRLVAAASYLAVAAACLIASARGGNAALMAAAALLVALTSHSFVSAWPRRIDATEALATAARAVGFPIGHASAQLSWTGVRSRPVWRILISSAHDLPAKRGLVEVDGVNGRALSQYVEDDPEADPEAGRADAMHETTRGESRA